MKDRAIEEWQKKDVLEKIFQLWIKYPELRLGQLIEDARFLSEHNAAGEIPDLFYIEDYKLVTIIDEFVKKIKNEHEKKI